MSKEDELTWEPLLILTRQEVERQLARLSEHLGPGYSRVQVLMMIRDSMPELTEAYLRTPEGKQSAPADLARMQQVLQEVLTRMIRENSN